MKLAAVLLLAIISVVASSPAKNSEEVNVQEILNNRRLLLPYIKCALNQGKCTSAGKELKDNIKDTLETDCGKCTEEQKKDNQLIFKHLINKEKDYWAQLVTKYDPEKKFAPKYEGLYLGKA